MTLIDRYIAEVARRLPRNRRGDISRELHSTLLDAMESRFGPDASEEDAATVLREFGPPETMAASYQPSSQYLVGPEWYPTFRTVVNLLLMALVGVLIAGFALAIFVPSSTEDIGKVLSNLAGGVVQAGLIMYAVAILVFHLLERAEVRIRGPRKTWNPHSLPVVKDRDFVGCGEPLAPLVLTAVGLVVAYQLQDRIGIPYNGRLLLNDVLKANLLMIAASALATMSHYGLLVWRRRWEWYTRVTKIVTDLFGLYVTYRISAGIIADRAQLLDAGIPEQIVNGILQGAAAIPYLGAALIAFEAIRMFLRLRQDAPIVSPPKRSASVRA